ncbi:MAG: lysine 2,3-aminomutase [Oligoflexia bacterium]|nr:lysine 2,3-aminomutase [Oligoflexia bacterium]
MSLSAELREEMRLVSLVFPFRVNSYVLKELINWNDPTDAIYRMVFPRREMLSPAHFERVYNAERANDAVLLAQTVAAVRRELNPHPAGQTTKNVPRLADGTALPGLQHKYKATVLVFPRQGQTCHAYCTFCFRWPQFVGDTQLRIETSDINGLIAYLREHPEVSDVLFTGGDPFVMPSAVLRKYVDALLAAKLDNIRSIRFGTKALSYWPFRFTSDADASDLKEILKSIIVAGKHLTIVAHFTHPHELGPSAVKQAIKVLQDCGAVIRTQTPLLRGINDSANTLAKLWQSQVSLGCIPYYLFAARDTGAQHLFGVPLAESCSIFREALSACSGLVGTVHGPVMSAEPGKIEVLGAQEIANEKVFQLRFLQARRAEWCGRLFSAAYDEKAQWISDLRPAFGASHFFYEA